MAAITKLKPGTDVTVMQCSCCGRLESALPAPCCPGCGTSDDPLPILTRVVRYKPRKR